MLSPTQLLFIFAFATLVIGQTPPFCTNQPLCKCEKVKDDAWNINCDGQVKFQDLSNWIEDPTTNEAYKFNRLIINNSPVLTLDTVFPPSNLTYLQLAQSSIVTINANIFSNLQNMKELILSYNAIETIDPKALNGLYEEGDLTPLRSLTTLFLDHNKIHSLNADVFEHTSRIKELYLSHNPITIIDLHTSQAITSLTELERLDLSYTGIQTLPNAFLHTPRLINFLDLSGNLIAKVPQTLGDSHALETLYINNNPIQKLDAKNAFPQIKTLKRLHMAKMEFLEAIEAHSLSKLPNLQELKVYECNHLKNFSGKALANREEDAEYATYPPITRLYLNHNQLTSIDFGMLNNWGSLTELDINGNPWTCECENQWMIDELMPIYLKTNLPSAKTLTCEAPIEMAGKTFYEIMESDASMRCLDYYGNRPENDGILLIGMLAGVLITIPIILSLVYLYKRHWFGLFDDSPAAFSRRFYSKTDTNEAI